MQLKHNTSLVPRPLLPKERPGTHCLCMCIIFSVKSFMLLPCLYAEDYTNQEYRALFSSGNLTCRMLLEYYFSDVAVSFFQTYSQNRKVKSQFTKSPVGSHKTLISLHTQLAAAPSWTRSAFTTETAALANSKLPREAAALSCIYMKQICMVHICT